MNAKFEKTKDELDASAENAWQSMKLALHECADALLIEKQQPRKNWLSAKTMQLIDEKKSAYHLWLRYRKEGAQIALKKRKEGANMALIKDQEQGHQKKQSDPWQKYRATANACRKSVRQDKKTYWKEMSEALT